MIDADVDVVSYTLLGAFGTPLEHVIESRTRVATRDDDLMFWVLRKKNTDATLRPFADWEYDELRYCGATLYEDEAALWVVEGFFL